MKKNMDTLEKLIDRKPFRTPEGYFEQFADTLMSRLPDNAPVKQRPKIRLIVRAQRWLAAAVVFLGLLTVYYVYERKTDDMTVRDITVKNISMQTVSQLGNDSESKTEFFDYLTEEYSKDNTDELIDNFEN